MTPAEADGVLFDGTMHCADELPLDWQAGPGAPAEVLQERNFGVLRVLTRLAEHAPDPAEDKAAREPDLARVEAKIDLVLELVGSLLALQRPPPSAAALRLSCRGLVWHDAPRLELGASGRALLHLHPAVPQPLELAATVIAADEEALPRRVWLRFDAVPGPLASELERYTFRRHRRAVAGLRQARG